MKIMRTVGRECGRKWRPSNRKALNACWQARDKEARPSERNRLHNGDRMNEMHALDDPQDAAREPFNRNTTENGERSIENMPWRQRELARRTRGQNTQDFLLLAFSLLLLDLSARRQ